MSEKKFINELGNKVAFSVGHWGEEVVLRGKSSRSITEWFITRKEAEVLQDLLNQFMRDIDEEEWSVDRH